jgi:hypothetical protein
MLMADSYLTRFVKVIEKEGGRFAGHDDKGRLLLAEYLDEQFEPPLVLDFDEDEFLEGLQAMGDSGQHLWPDVSALEGAYRLALVHLYEGIVKIKRQPPTRMHFTTSGLIVD